MDTFENYTKNPQIPVDIINAFPGMEWLPEDKYITTTYANRVFEISGVIKEDVIGIRPLTGIPNLTPLEKHTELTIKRDTYIQSKKPVHENTSALIIEYLIICTTDSAVKGYFDNLTEYLYFPFAPGPPIRYTFNNFEHMERQIDNLYQCYIISLSYKFLNQYLKQIKRGNEGFVDFFLKDAPEMYHQAYLKYYGKTIPTSLSHMVEGIKGYRLLMMDLLKQEGMLSDEDYDINYAVRGL